MSSLDVQNAIALLEQGRSKDAVQLLRRMTDAMPVYTTAYVLMARAYEAEESWHDALVAWQHAQLLMPNSPSIRDGLRRVADRLANPPAEAAPGAPPPALPAEEAPPAAPADAPPVLVVEETALEPEETVPEPEQIAPEPEETVPEPPAEAEQERAPEPPPTRPTWRSGRERPRDDEAEPARDAEPTPPNVEDLDRLINELESARIVPRPDVDVIPTPDLEDEIEDVVSETLARIYTAQRQYGEAARAYERLAEQHPERADEFRRMAAEMREKQDDE